MTQALWYPDDGTLSALRERYTSTSKTNGRWLCTPPPSSYASADEKPLTSIKHPGNVARGKEGDGCMEYLNFDLEIHPRSEERYPVVARSEAGEARQQMRFPLEGLALEN